MDNPISASKFTKFRVVRGRNYSLQRCYFLIVDSSLC